jgi:tetratricopeptide (TPR) repeat protein
VSELLLKGAFYRSRWGEADIRKGIDYYNRAIALDPNVVDAYGGLASAWISLSDLYASPRDAMPRARAAAEEVLRRDDAWPYAHVSLGVIKLQYDWDFAGADREFARAMTLEPNETIGRVLRGWLRMAEGRLPEAQADMQRAVDEVPSEINLWSLGLSFYFAGQYEAAIEQYRRAIAVEPRSYWAHLSLGWAYERQGHVDDAIKELELTRGLLDTPQVVAALVHAQAAAGRRVEAQATMTWLLDYAKRKYVSPYDLATASAGLGDRTEAMAWLEKAYEDRSGWLALWLKIDPTFDSLRADDRFRDLLTRVGHTP